MDFDQNVGLKPQPWELDPSQPWQRLIVMQAD